MSYMEHIILVTFFAFFAGVTSTKIYFFVTDLILHYRMKSKFANLEVANEESRCKETHDWVSIFLVMRQIPPAKYHVCSKCGFVSGTKYKLNKPGLEIYSERMKIKKLEDEQLDKRRLIRQRKLDDAMNRLVKENIEKLTQYDVNSNVEVLRNFFRQSVIEIDSVTIDAEKESRDRKDG